MLPNVVIVILLAAESSKHVFFYNRSILRLGQMQILFAVAMGNCVIVLFSNISSCRGEDLIGSFVVNGVWI